MDEEVKRHSVGLVVGAFIIVLAIYAATKLSKSHGDAAGVVLVLVAIFIAGLVFKLTEKEPSK